MSKQQNIDELPIGCYRRLKVTVTDPDNNNAPLDLTSVQEIRWVLSALPSYAVKVSKTLEDGITILDQTVTENVGQFLVEIAPTDTDGFKPGIYYHEARVVDYLGRPDVVVWGKVTVKASPSNS
jgi:hypothetical protein